MRTGSAPTWIVSVSRDFGIGLTILPIRGRLYETGHLQKSSESSDPAPILFTLFLLARMLIATSTSAPELVDEHVDHLVGGIGLERDAARAAVAAAAETGGEFADVDGAATIEN